MGINETKNQNMKDLRKRMLYIKIKFKMRYLYLCCFMLLFLSLCGCLKQKTYLTLMPDGSGKIEVFYASTISLPNNTNIQTLGDNVHGSVAITNKRIFKENDWECFTYTVYFEDINKLEFIGGEGTKITYTLSKDDQNYILVIENQRAAEESKKQLQYLEKSTPEELLKMQRVFRGLEITEVYELPGEVYEYVGGLSQNGRVVSAILTEREVTDKIKMEKAIKSQWPLKRTIGYRLSEIDSDKIKIFKNEMRQAKESSARQLSE